MLQRFLLSVLFINGFANTLLAQQQGQNGTATVITQRPTRNLFVELGGAGMIMTFNYDQRFTKSDVGIGGRIGIGGFALPENDHLVAIPVGINYLMGKNGKYFEIGAGATYFGGNAILDDTNEVMGNLVFGYRRQPEDGGFMFRAGLTPFFNHETFIPYVGHLSFGYTF